MYVAAKCYHRYDDIPSVLDEEDSNFKKFHDLESDFVEKSRLQKEPLTRYYLYRYYVEMVRWNSSTVRSQNNGHFLSGLFRQMSVILAPF